MRMFLLSLSILGGAAAAAAAAHATPGVGPIPLLTGQPMMHNVQYYEDWRYREWRRHEAFERWRRHEEWRRWHHHYRHW